MSKKRTRIAFTPTEELYTALQRFSEVTGYSMSSIVGTMLSDSLPVINAMTEAFIVAKSSPAQAVEKMDSALQAGLHKAVQAQLDLHESAKKPKMRKRNRD